MNVSSAIDTRVVRTTLGANETPQHAWNPKNPICKCTVGVVSYYQCVRI